MGVQGFGVIGITGGHIFGELGPIVKNKGM